MPGRHIRIPYMLTWVAFDADRADVGWTGQRDVASLSLAGGTSRRRWGIRRGQQQHL